MVNARSLHSTRKAKVREKASKKKKRVLSAIPGRCESAASPWILRCWKLRVMQNARAQRLVRLISKFVMVSNSCVIDVIGTGERYLAVKPIEFVKWCRK
jgi:hypothetical protein